MSDSLDSFVAVPIPTALYLELANRYPGLAATVIENVLGDFLDRMDDPVWVEKKGVHWESLFLPDGTAVKTKHLGQTHTATINGNDIVWDGKIYPSMSQLAKAMRGNTSNNAWKVLDVKRPGDAGWQLADRLRK